MTAEAVLVEARPPGFFEVRDGLAEVATTLEKTLKTAQRVLGREHPRTGNIRHELEECKKLVIAREA